MIWSVAPQPLLQPFVRSFGFREAVVTAALRYPVPARPLQFIEFYLRDRYQVVDFATNITTLAPPIVVLGQQTRRLADLYLLGDYAVFTIHFHPTGFHQLFGVSMSELTDQAIAAEAVLGKAITTLHERLQHATSLSERVVLAERFLLKKAREAAPTQPVAWAVQELLTHRGLVSLKELQAASGLGQRQLERQFERVVGVTPKRFARVLRFQHALALEKVYGERSWAQIATEAGYFDQTHLIKDFRALSGQTPTLLHRALRASASWSGS